MTEVPGNSVDAELFPSLQDAIAFIESLGGGTVYTELAGTVYANGLKLPPRVKLESKREE